MSRQPRGCPRGHTGLFLFAIRRPPLLARPLPHRPRTIPGFKKFERR